MRREVCGMTCRRIFEVRTWKVAPVADETQTNSPTSGNRFAIALGSWCFAGIGVLLSVMLAGASLATDSSGATTVLMVVPFCAWVALAVMTVRWVQEQRCHWLWPVLGTLCGIVSAVMFAAAFLVYISALPLAVYLVFWHLKHTR